MKTLPPKLTARQFYQACLLFNTRTPGEVASMFQSRSLPDWNHVAKVAEDMACELTPHDSAAPVHIRFLEVSDWAKEMADAV